MANSSQTPHEQPLQVKVVGLFKSSSFQIAKSAAEVTAKKQPQGREGPSRFRVVRLLVAGVEVQGGDVPAGMGCLWMDICVQRARAGPGGSYTSRRATFKERSERRNRSEPFWE